MNNVTLVLGAIILAGCGQEEIGFEEVEGGRLFPFSELRGAWDPAYSADGERVLFVMDGDIWTMPAGGGPPSRRSNLGTSIISPNWDPTPGSNRVCFVTNTHVKSILMVMELDHEPLELYSSVEEITSSSWSFDGEYIVFTFPTWYEKGIFRVPAAGGQIEVILNKEGWQWDIITACECSHSDNSVIYASARYGNQQILPRFVSRLPIEGGWPEVIIIFPDEIMNVSNVCDSFDGKYIAVITESESNNGSYNSELSIVDAVGEQTRVAGIESENARYLNPSWSPDASSILMQRSLWTGDDYHRYNLFRLEFDSHFLY
jgi:hypothetical protein